MQFCCQTLTRWVTNKIILMSIAQSLNNALYFVKMYSNTANAMLCFSNCCHWKQYGMYCIIMSIFLENYMILEHNCPQFPIQNIIFLFPHYTYTSKLWRCIEGTTLLPLYLLYFWSYFQTKKSSLTFYVWLKVFST